MTNLKLQKTDNSDVVSNISYDYYSGGGGSGGNNGRVRYITDHLDGNYSVDVGYDDHNRLTSYGSYRSYSYDAWNNLLSVSSSNGVGEAPNYTLSYATNASGAPSTNRINNSGYTFDNAGNVTNDGSLAYAYDAAGRLKTAGTNNSCEYDGDGRKVKQVSGGYPLFYLWSSVLGEPVVELDGSGGVYRAYVPSSGGQMLAVQSYDGGFYWLHTDHLGNGRKLTNTSGTVIYRAEFDPHGQILYEWQSSGLTYLNSHKFTGYERDWATNLNYAKARTYNHNRARFLQPDPIGLAASDPSNPQSLNLYSYVGNDSMNFVDPDGLNARMCFGYYISISNDGGESWTTIGFIPIYCWDVGGGGSGGGGGGGGNSTATGNQQGQQKTCPPDPKALAKVDQELKKTGLDAFIRNKQVSASGKGYLIEFNDPNAAAKFLQQQKAAEQFAGGGSGGSQFHQNELKARFGGSSGATFADYRSHRSGFGPSLQVDLIIDKDKNVLGGYVDTDKFNPKQDPFDFLGHTFFEVIPFLAKGGKNC
jgi:RHS repeat-associated protein